MHLAARREHILKAWIEATAADAEMTTVSALTRAQFIDHIPQLLDAFELKLRSKPGTNPSQVADQEQSLENVKHGLQRWQQGYQLKELMREWGHLHLCLFHEIERFATDPEIPRPVALIAQRELISLINEGINESASQYARMQRAEAAGHVEDLQKALTHLTSVEQRRAELIRQAVHDLRGNVQTVSTAADFLREEDLPASDRAKIAQLVQTGVDTLSSMLGDLMTLSRLEAGLERREVQTFDAAAILAELCNSSRPLASQRALELRDQGPASLVVEGDAGKVRRIIQNLLLNALKYTDQGGVTVTWGEEPEKWWVDVKDTGPGLHTGSGGAMVAGLEQATHFSHEADRPPVHTVGGMVVSDSASGAVSARAHQQQSGEGIGLSIVKRLCELLDASLELASSAPHGTQFRVRFPRRYDPGT
ncbi:MAG: HAMP domain-containing histidine kinase [Verrucomicrobiales bacterium]|nr:HAMP domain-containing histidine kinase [Verrucomicrobiales bacterium]